jgi:hypothetical protein
MTGVSCAHCPGSHTGRLSCLASATTKASGGWLLVEHPGPWASELTGTALPPAVAAAVDTARRHGLRPQLIRRTGRRRPTPPLRVYVGRSLGPEPWLECRELADPDELADLDLAAVAAGRRPDFGSPVTEPLLLVCTHGRHNACCARLGGPLARQLTARFGDLVWETTHVGGDRFAANLIYLPYGLCYGNLGYADAVAAVEAGRRGEVVLERYRGRAGLSEPAQAAEHFVRAHTGMHAVSDVVVQSVTGSPVATAVVRTPKARYQVRVERVPADPPCGTECQEELDTYIQRDLGLLSAATLV